MKESVKIRCIRVKNVYRVAHKSVIQYWLLLERENVKLIQPVISGWCTEPRVNDLMLRGRSQSHAEFFKATWQTEPLVVLWKSHYPSRLRIVLLQVGSASKAIRSFPDGNQGQKTAQESCYSSGTSCGQEYSR